MLLKGDCLELMKTLPDKSVDLFVCDLPYGCLSAKRGGVRVGECPADNPNGNIVVVDKPCDWDIKLNMDLFWTQVKRLRKDAHTPCLMFCDALFGFDLFNSNPKWFRYELIWNKMRGVAFLLANKMPMKSHEKVFVFAEKGANYYRVDVKGIPYSKKSKGEVVSQYDAKRTEGINTGTRCALSVIDCLNTAGHNGGQHPTAKPVELYKWLIERYSKEGDCVLDPTFGSGNSIVAGEALGRKCIGIEMNEGFFTSFQTKWKELGKENVVL
jgi:site-specific DNA-methyltransferase (adenine-specific)